MPNDSWTPKKIDRLRARWLAGDSASVIGTVIGMSKNAVIGKARRVGLKARPSPIQQATVSAEAVQELADAGWTKAEAARKLGVGYNVVCGVATHRGIKFQLHRPTPAAQQRGRETATARAEERRAEVVRLKREGWSNHDIAQEVHMRRDTIGKILKEAGLSTPRRPPTTPVVRLPRQRTISFVSTTPTAPSMPGVTRFSCLAPGVVPEVDGCQYVTNNQRPWQFCAEPAAVERCDGALVRRSFCAGHMRVCYQHAYAAAA